MKLKIKKARKNNMNFEKPNGYDEVEVNNGDYTPIQLGGHKLVITVIEEVQASNGNKYLKVSFDTDLDDIQPKYFTEQWKNDQRENKKWSGVAVIFPTDREGKTSKTFKQFCTSIEKSNNSKIQWGENFDKSIIGRKVGGVFGEEEYLANGEVKTARKLFFWRSIENVMDAKIPNKREVDKPNETDTGFIEVPQGIAEELPFS